MLQSDINNNVIHFRFKDAATADDVEDMYTFFGIHSFDCDDDTQIVYDFSAAYFKDNGFMDAFIELTKVYPFKTEYFSGLKKLGQVIFDKVTTEIGEANRNYQLVDLYETLCEELNTTPISYLESKPCVVTEKKRKNQKL